MDQQGTSPSHAPNLEIELETANLDMDENGGRSGAAHVAGRAGEPGVLDMILRPPVGM
jgi:hypothetical protein